MPADPVLASVAISAHRFDGADSVVLARADALILAIAAPLAAALDAPLLAVDLAVPDHPALRDELRRLNATRRIAVGIDVADAAVETLGEPGQNLAELSIAVADEVRRLAGTVRAFAIGDSDQARVLAGPVAAAAALRRFPVMVGAEAARHAAMEGKRRAAVTYLVGQDVIGAAAQVPGGFPLPAPTTEAVVKRLAQLLRADGIETDTAVLTAPDTDPTLTAALAGAGGPIVYLLSDPPPGTVFTATAAG